MITYSLWRLAHNLDNEDETSKIWCWPLNPNLTEIKSFPRYDILVKWSALLFMQKWSAKIHTFLKDNSSGNSGRTSERTDRWLERSAFSKGLPNWSKKDQNQFAPFASTNILQFRIYQILYNSGYICIYISLIAKLLCKTN